MWNNCSPTDKGPIQSPGSVGLRAQTLALAGRQQEARAELDRILERSKQHFVAAYNIALIYAALADTDNTFLWLDRAMQDRSTLLVFLAQDPMFAAWHADPRFASLVRRIGVFDREPRTVQASRPAIAQNAKPHEQPP